MAMRINDLQLHATRRMCLNMIMSKGSQIKSLTSMISSLYKVQNHVELIHAVISQGSHHFGGVSGGEERGEGLKVDTKWTNGVLCL